MTQLMWEAAAASLALMLVVAPAAEAAQAPPGDGPVRQPVEAWSNIVACDSAHQPGGDGPAGRACTVEFADSSIYVFEHETVDDPAAGHLVAFDPVTGAERWSVTTAAAERVTVSHAAVVLADKTHVEVIDPNTGTSRFSRPGRLVGVNDYGIVLVETAAQEDGRPTIEAVDGVTGTPRWTVEPGMDVGAVCRDIVVLVPATGAAPQPFRVVEHHTGATRWSGEDAFEPASDTLRCSGAWLYTTDGESLTEWDSVVGWLNWETTIDGGAASAELYREVALVRSTGAGTVTAVERETGEVLWTRPAAELGSVVSSRARLRRDGSTVFTLHPQSGEVVDRVDLDRTADGSVRFVAASECRLVVAAGSTVTTFGVRDLTATWTLELGGVPDDIGVVAGTLVVRLGDRLVGHRSPPSEVTDASDGASPRCTF